MTTTNNKQRAIARIGAWYKITPAELDLLGKMLADPAIGRGVAYSEWCACTGIEMPQGWTP